MDNQEPYRLIALTGQKGAGMHTKVSIEDYDHVLEYGKNWNLCKGYAICIRRVNGKRKTVYMHTVITGELHTDHINGDKLDNRRTNLFAGGQGENNRNTNKKTPASSSQFPGVCRDKQRQKWQAYIKINKVQTTLGRFTNELEAAHVYYQAAKQQHPHLQHPAWNTPRFIAYQALQDTISKIEMRLDT